MSEVVNLYFVAVYDAFYGYFVFASTPNKARALCTRFNDDSEEYIYLRAYIRAKNIGGENNVVVDHEGHEDYKRVLATGNRYGTEEEAEEYQENWG